MFNKEAFGDILSAYTGVTVGNASLSIINNSPFGDNERTVIRHLNKYSNDKIIVWHEDSIDEEGVVSTPLALDYDNPDFVKLITRSIVRCITMIDGRSAFIFYRDVNDLLPNQEYIKTLPHGEKYLHFSMNVCVHPEQSSDVHNIIKSMILSKNHRLNPKGTECLIAKMSIFDEDDDLLKKISDAGKIDRIVFNYDGIDIFNEPAIEEKANLSDSEMLSLIVEFYKEVLKDGSKDGSERIADFVQNILTKNGKL